MPKRANKIDHVLDRMVLVALGERAEFKSHAEALGIPPETIKTWRRRGEVPLTKLKDFAQDWKVSLDWLMNGGPETGDETAADELGENVVRMSRSRAYGADAAINRWVKNFVMVPRYNVRAGAGGGQAIHDDSVVDHLAFKRDWIRSDLDLDPEHLALIEVHGDSMVPTLKDGDLILVDLRNGKRRNAGVYVIQLDGHLLVKRLNRKLDGSVEVISDNPAYPPEVLGPEAADLLHVIGRVVWSGGRM